jgi:uncharacterized membrane protein
MSGAEELLASFIDSIRLAIEAVSALVIGFGVATTLYQGIRARIATGAEVYQQTRGRLAHFLVLGLELQLAADILMTAIAPSWDQIAKLAAIAAIRTFLNFFLLREQRDMEIEKGQPRGSAY